MSIGYTPPKFIGEVLVDLVTLDKRAAAQETWYSLTLSKGLGKKERKIVEGADMRFSLTFEETLVLPQSRYQKLTEVPLLLLLPEKKKLTLSLALYFFFPTVALLFEYSKVN